MQARFGIVAISPKDFYFLEERPQHWVDETDMKHRNYGHTTDLGEGTKGAAEVNPQEAGRRSALIRDVEIEQPGGKQQEKAEDYFTMESITSTQVINGRIPALEFEHKPFNGAKDSQPS